MKKTLQLFILISSALSFFSCAPKVLVDINKNTEISFVSEQQSDLLLSAFEQLNPDFENTHVIDPEKLSAELNKHFFKIKHIKLLPNNGINITVSDTPQTNILKKIINHDANAGVILIELSKKNVAEFLQILPDDTRENLDLLAAPAFTGENLTHAEYIQLFSAIYGNALTEELTKSIFTLKICCPKKIKSAKINDSFINTTKNNAEFKIPLTNLLVLEKPFSINIQY